MKRTLEKMKPTCLDDLAVANALYRPGAMKYIDNYIARKHGEEEFEYLHPDLENILKPTYGIIVFQEQLIEVGRLAKMRNSDKLRKATGKKLPKLMAECRDELIKGLVQDRGWTNEQFEQLWKDMLEFSKYSFNKSHSFAYAIIAYICAFLKVYHPKEFMTALFNSFDGKPDRFEGIYLEAKRLGVQVDPISFKNPVSYCALTNDKINYGMKLVKHCNLQMAESLYNLKDNDYKFFTDLLVDIIEKTAIDSRQMKILIQLDFFKKFGEKQLIFELYDSFKNGKGIKYDKKYVEKSKIKRIQLQHENETNLKQTFKQAEQISLYKPLEIEKEFYGFMRTTYLNQDENTFAIIDINDKYTPILSLYNLKTGDIIKLKVKKKKYYDKDGIPHLYVGDVINITGTSEDGKWYMDENEEWKQRDDIQEAFLQTCKLVERKVENAND
jgi:DNA polymerase-3 subunit alpha